MDQSTYVQDLNLQIVDAAVPRITEKAVGKEWRAAGADERQGGGDMPLLTGTRVRVYPWLQAFNAAS
jgi:hypothetical protein